MLVIISDLHLTDHTSGETIEQGAFFLLRERLFSLADDASWRAPNVYKPIEQVELLLLGDILDVIRSSRWCSAPHARPWTDPPDNEFIELVSDITTDILAKNEKSMQVIKNLSHSITIPAADENHRPVSGKDDFLSRNRVIVPVRVHYMVGNHDWFYHLPGEAFEAILLHLIFTDSASALRAAAEQERQLQLLTTTRLRYQGRRQKPISPFSAKVFPDYRELTASVLIFIANESTVTGITSATSRRRVLWISAGSSWH